MYKSGSLVTRDFKTRGRDGKSHKTPRDVNVLHCNTFLALGLLLPQLPFEFLSHPSENRNNQNGGEEARSNSNKECDPHITERTHCCEPE